MGVVYILKNEAFSKDFYKIGQSSRSGRIRALELNASASTGTPGLYECIYERETSDPTLAEREIFDALKNFRRGKNHQEFFCVDLQFAIGVIDQICANINKIRNNNITAYKIKLNEMNFDLTPLPSVSFARPREMTASVLNVYIDQIHIGNLFDEIPLSFEYTQGYLRRAECKPIHTDIPLISLKHSNPIVTAFFENFLPEGERRYISQSNVFASPVFGLLYRFGGDMAGSIQLAEPNVEICDGSHKYYESSWPNFLKENRDNFNSRSCLAGAQRKVLISISENGNPLLPIGNAPTTHVLKPNIIWGSKEVFGSAANESIVMRTAELCGLNIAKSKYKSEVNAILIERYDRIEIDGELRRIWQADFCQLLGMPSTMKYEADGGPSFKACFDFIGAKSSQPGVDKRHLLQWLFFNLYTGNNDSHAKNISMLATSDGLQLAPFYDLMCTRVYAGLGQNFSFQIGGEYNPGKINSTHLAALAKELGVKPAYLAKIGRDMATSIKSALPKAVSELTPAMSFNERAIATRLQDKILSIARKSHDRIFSANGQHDEDELDSKETEGPQLS